MRTTLNIDDDVLRAAKEIARLEGRSVGDVLSDLARQTLRRDRPVRELVQRNGVPLLPDRPEVRTVTSHVVGRLAEPL